MTRSRRVKRNLKNMAAERPLLMAGIPVNRPHSYEHAFFETGTPVLQGIGFPLHRRSFKRGHIQVSVDIRMLGAPRSAPDARSISYAGCRA
jgi:hypothetical protein